MEHKKVLATHYWHVQNPFTHIEWLWGNRGSHLATDDGARFFACFGLCVWWFCRLALIGIVSRVPVIL